MTLILNYIIYYDRKFESLNVDNVDNVTHLLALSVPIYFIIFGVFDLVEKDNHTSVIEAQKIVLIREPEFYF